MAGGNGVCVGGCVRACVLALTTPVCYCCGSVGLVLPAPSLLPRTQDFTGNLTFLILAIN